MKRARQSGSVFTVLLAGIGLTAALGISIYHLFTGPVSSVTRVTQKSLADTQILAISKILITDAAKSAGSGDCDADGFIEPLPWRSTTSNRPGNGGLVPLTIGATVTDPWKSDYGYCVWDVGPASADAGCGGATGRLDGADDPAADTAKTQTVIAVISAGPDRQFQTICNAYVNAATDLVAAGGDDIVLRHTYEEASASAFSLWSLKAGTPGTAEIDMDLEIGDDITFEESTGLIQALGISTTGKVSAGGGVQLGDEDAIPTCDAANEGLMRYTTGVDTTAIRVKQATPLKEDPNVDTSSVSFTALPTGGNTIIVMIGGWTGSGYPAINNGAVTDNQGNTYIKAVEDSGVASMKSFIFYASNISAPSGTFTITVNPAGTGAYLSVSAIEVSGLLSAGALDQVNNVNGGPGATTITISTPAATAQANELVVAADYVRSDDDDVNFTYTNSWTQRFLDEDARASAPAMSSVGFSGVTKIVNAAGVVSHTWTHDALDDGTSAVMATFKGSCTVNCTGDGANLEVCTGGLWDPIFDPAEAGLLTKAPNLVITPGSQAGMNVDGTCGTPTCYGTSATFTVRNYGEDTSDTITAVTLSNTTNFEFVSDSCTGTVLVKDATCTLVVRPKATGNKIYTSNLTITGNNSPFATLSGTSVYFECMPGRTGAGGKYAACGLTDSLTGSTYDLIVMPGGCTGSTSNPTCAGGSDTYTARFSTGWCCGTATHDISFYGEENIGARASLYIDQVQTVTGNSFPANNYCQQMDYGGYTDWYLPARYEMRDYIYPSKTAIGGFVNADYQTSRVGWNNDVGKVLMTNGTAGMDSYSINNYVRCARRDNLAPPPALADTNPLNVSFGPKVATVSGARTLSAVASISGFLQNVNVAVTGGDGNPKIKINGGGEVDSGTISAWNQTVQLVMDAPAVVGSSNAMTVSIGDDSYTWRVYLADGVTESRAFVTAAVYSPTSVSGIGNADTICTNAAVSAGIGGTWKAILSDDKTSAINRVPWNWVTLKRLDGVVVASGWDDLWDGSLQNPLNLTQDATTSNVCVWTGTKTDGSSYSGVTALNWQAGNQDARYGTSSSTTSTWINNSSAQGDSSCALYCLEQTAGAASDILPASFTIPYVVQAATNARVVSDPVTISALGPGVNATVTLAGNGSPAFTKNGGGELASGNTVTNGDVLRVVMTAPSTGNTSNSMTVKVGDGAAVKWRVWTGDPTGTVTKRVFVTNSTWNGNLGGVTGADLKCQAAANAASLGGTWKAIISGPTEAEWAVNRIGYNWSTLKLVNNTTTVVAAGNLWKTSTQALVSSISMTENGTTVNADAHTNTNSSGRAAYSGTSDGCTNYSTTWNNGINTIGRTASTGTAWVSGGSMSGWECSDPHRLYCIEQ